MKLAGQQELVCILAIVGDDDPCYWSLLELLKIQRSKKDELWFDDAGRKVYVVHPLQTTIGAEKSNAQAKG